MAVDCLKDPITLQSSASGEAVAEASRSVSHTSSELPFPVICFAPSLIALGSFGIALVLLCATMNPGVVQGAMAAGLALFVHEWLDLYGARLTREERVFFDEKNILATSKAFDFLLGPVLDDTTPGGTQQDACCGKYPAAGLLADLLADPKQKEMQEFYKQHYGGMYSTALRVSQEAKASASGASTIGPNSEDKPQDGQDDRQKHQSPKK